MKIGIRVIALKDHPKGIFFKGQIFTITDIAMFTCSCMGEFIIICFGQPLINKDRSCCAKCHTFCYYNDYYWFDARRFKPLDDLSDYLPEQLIEELETTNVITA